LGDMSYRLKEAFVVTAWEEFWTWCEYTHELVSILQFLWAWIIFGLI